MLLNCGVGEDSWESLGLQGDPTSPFWRRSALGVHWKDWCWSWNSNTLATWCEKLTHSKIPWCWEGLGAGGEGDDRGWDGWMASQTQCTWVWVDSGSWWWTGSPGMLQFMGSQRVRHYWATELNWTELTSFQEGVVAKVVYLWVFILKADFINWSIQYLLKDSYFTFIPFLSDPRDRAMFCGNESHKLVRVLSRENPNASD